MTANPEAPAFPPGEYTTRDGRKARVYANDAGGRRPIHGAVENSGGWAICVWHADGRMFGKPDGADLLPPRPATRKVRVAVGAFVNKCGDLVAAAEVIESAPMMPAWLRDMPDGKPAEVEIEIIDRRPK